MRKTAVAPAVVLAETEAEEGVGDALVDVSEMSLDDLERGDNSVLSDALRRLAEEKDDPRDQTAFHTDHTDSHSSSPW